jgi:hypothetical protein
MATQTNPGPAYAYLLRIYRAGDQTNTAAPEAGDSINLAARSSGARDGPNEKGARWKSARAQLAACSPLNTAGSEFPATPSPFATNLPVQMTTSPLDQQQFQRTLIA